jgi:prolycopene isomerase
MDKARLYFALLPFVFRLKWDAQRLMDSYFSSRELQCVFISILADFFSSPTQFPGLGVFALNAEAAYEHRVPKLIDPRAETLYHYSILGGISTLVDALVGRIEQLGGNVLTGNPVTCISVENNRITGVVVSDSTFHPAEVVISSGGARETFLKLVGEELLPQDFIQKLYGMALMDSVFMVHLGLDFDPSPWLHGAVTYFYGSYDIEGGIDEAHRGIYHQGERGFVVHVPSLHTPKMAPSSHHAMTIYTICPDRLKNGSWEENKEAFADALIGYAQEHIPELSRHVCTRHILTPEDFRKRTNLEHHAFGGIAPILGAPRIPHRTPIEGLWFIGAQSESGGGVNSVIPGAYKVAKSIISKRTHG